MLEKVRILIVEESRETTEQAKLLTERLRAEGIEAEEIRASGEKAKEAGVEKTGTAEGEMWITDCPEAVRRLAGDGCRILLYLTEKSRALPLGEYPYAVESLEGIGAEELEGICRRLSGKPWEILRTERLIVREQKEEDLDSLYEIYAHPDMTAFMEGLSADREEERERLISYIRTVYPARRAVRLWPVDAGKKRTGEKGKRRLHETVRRRGFGRPSGAGRRLYRQSRIFLAGGRCGAGTGLRNSENGAEKGLLPGGVPCHSEIWF